MNVWKKRFDAVSPTLYPIFSFNESLMWELPALRAAVRGLFWVPSVMGLSSLSTFQIDEPFAHSGTGLDHPEHHFRKILIPRGISDHDLKIPRFNREFLVDVRKRQLFRANVYRHGF